MDTPQIQYCKTSDGVSIAYWTMGEGGVPLVLTSPMLFCHASLELRAPGLREWYERLASHHTIVRFDGRGQGLSQRNVEEFDFDFFTRDLKAVIDSLDAEKVDLAGFYGPSMSAMLYAATHPDRLRKLVLWTPFAENRTSLQSPRMRAVLSLIESDYRLFCETFAHQGLGWTTDLSHEWAMFISQAINQQDAARLFAAIAQADVRDKIARVVTPSLVLYEAGGDSEVAEAARFVAASLSDARLVPLPHKLVPAFQSEAGIQAIEDFLSSGKPARQPAQSLPRSVSSGGTAIILFADIAESTALTERMGDAAFREKARALDEALRRAITSNGGTAIEGKLLGDGVLAVFGAAREAIACAQEMHRLAEVSSPPRAGEGPGEGSALLLHVGVHAGDVIRENNNVYGGAVNIAARVASEAAAGETLVSATVRDLARTSAGVSFEDRGERELKGVGDTVRVWAVRWRE
jgi:class 3 adenylate cyclase